MDTVQQYTSYWEVILNPQPRQNVMEYRFVSLELVRASIDITWGKFPKEERPVLDLVTPGATYYHIRDHSGTRIGSVKYVRDVIAIYTTPTHF